MKCPRSLLSWCSRRTATKLLATRGSKDSLSTCSGIFRSPSTSITRSDWPLTTSTEASTSTDSGMESSAWSTGRCKLYPSFFFFFGWWSFHVSTQIVEFILSSSASFTNFIISAIRSIRGRIATTHFITFDLTFSPSCPSDHVSAMNAWICPLIPCI